jgi:hypothetical protein
VAERLSNTLEGEKRRRMLSNVRIGRELALTHLLFVDDVLYFCLANERDITKLKEVLQLFKKASGMEINEINSTL